jgi:hypothetical protein
MLLTVAGEAGSDRVRWRFDAVISALTVLVLSVLRINPQLWATTASQH